MESLAVYLAMVSRILEMASSQLRAHLIISVVTHASLMLPFLDLGVGAVVGILQELRRMLKPFRKHTSGVQTVAAEALDYAVAMFGSIRGFRDGQRGDTNIFNMSMGSGSKRLSRLDEFPESGSFRSSNARASERDISSYMKENPPFLMRTPNVTLRSGLPPSSVDFSGTSCKALAPRCSISTGTW